MASEDQEQFFSGVIGTYRVEEMDKPRAYRVSLRTHLPAFEDPGIDMIDIIVNVPLEVGEDLPSIRRAARLRALKVIEEALNATRRAIESGP